MWAVSITIPSSGSAGPPFGRTRQPSGVDVELGAVGQRVAAAVGKRRHSQTEPPEDVEQIDPRAESARHLHRQEVGDLALLLRAAEVGNRLRQQAAVSVFLDCRWSAATISRAVSSAWSSMFSGRKSATHSAVTRPPAARLILPGRRDGERERVEIVRNVAGPVGRLLVGGDDAQLQLALGNASVNEVVPVTTGSRMSLCPSMTIARGAARSPFGYLHDSPPS